MILGLPDSSSYGKHLCAAGRAPIHPVREMPHLGMSALAGVMADGVWKIGYPTEGLKKRPA
jgi:hypothetical protein